MNPAPPKFGSVLLTIICCFLSFSDVSAENLWKSPTKNLEIYSWPFLTSIDTLPARPAIYRQFKTNEYMFYLQETRVQELSGYQRANQWIDQEAKKAPFVEDIEIPVVFHVLYTSDKDKISEEQALSQLEALNRDFQGKAQEQIRDDINPAFTKEGFDKRATSADIRFCLATENADGVQTKGVQYYEVTSKDWAYEDDGLKGTKEEGARPWDPERYLNVWVADLADSVSGYAQMPGGSSETDGIVIDHRFLGTKGLVEYPFDGGKTLTHLVGNYLGVQSIWGLLPCGDDGVEDTPLHNAPNFGCPGYQHISICYSNPVEMTMNFMDNTDDACMYMFTQGQKNRMHAALMEGGPRQGLAKGTSYCSENIIEEDIPEDIKEEKLNADPYLRVYPNPASQFFKLESGQLTDQSMRVEIRDAYGRKIWEHNAMRSNAILTIDCSGWTSGIYFVYVNQKMDRPVQKILVP